MKYLSWILFLLSLGYAAWLRFRVSSFIARYYKKADTGIANHIAWVEKELQKLKRI